MYLTKTPEIIRPFARDLTWRMPAGDNTLYITFDDGPHPDITPDVLQLLNDANAKATFFCIGGNVHKYKSVFEQLRAAGHSVGNHTYNHMNGWEFSDFSYYKNILECHAYLHSPLFRPPYGRIKRSQVSGVKKRFRIIMWDVLSADFDRNISPQKCFNNVIKGIEPGSIIVFHDSEKAGKNMRYALPKLLDYGLANGYAFRAIPEKLVGEPLAGKVKK